MVARPRHAMLARTTLAPRLHPSHAWGGRGRGKCASSARALIAWGVVAAIVWRGTGASRISSGEE
eukprot:3173832-Alexandrium_andersonii.AAC.1